MEETPDMPVCLNCGRQIETGGKFCESCAPYAEERTRDLYRIAGKTNYKPRRRGLDAKWLAVILVLVCLVLIIVPLILLTSITKNPKTIAREQAAVCRRNLEAIQDAIQKYHEDNGFYPSSNVKVDRYSPLVTGRYLKSAPRCPTTKKYYELVEGDNGGVMVICTSGKEGHSLEKEDSSGK